jgi:hypothetical protein
MGIDCLETNAVNPMKKSTGQSVLAFWLKENLLRVSQRILGIGKHYFEKTPEFFQWNLKESR